MRMTEPIGAPPTVVWNSSSSSPKAMVSLSVRPRRPVVAVLKLEGRAHSFVQSLLCLSKYDMDSLDKTRALSKMYLDRLNVEAGLVDKQRGIGEDRDFPGHAQQLHQLWNRAPPRCPATGAQ